VALELTPDKTLPSAVRQALHRPEVAAAMCLPVCFTERPVGVLNVSRLHGETAFRPGDVEVATVLAADAALSIQRLDYLRAQAHEERVAAVGRLASTIIHDLRGPMTVIRGAAELALERNPDLRGQVGLIEAQVDDLDRVCEQLLSFAREADRGDDPPCALARLVAQIERDSRPRCQRAGIDLVCDCQGDAYIQGSYRELSRVLLQVVEAACEAPPPGGRLAVMGRVAGQMVEIELAGEEPDPARWCSDLDPPAALAAGGAGLSLALARDVAERYHGWLEVATSPGAFSVCLRLPRREAA
jgi:signal transduction histidine kinase